LTRWDSDFGVGLRILFGTRLGWGILLFFAVVLLLPYTGFCFTHFRYLSDDELIDAAIRDVMASGGHSIAAPAGGYINFRPERPIRYGAVAEFRRLNPNCCRIVPNDPRWGSLFDEISGRAAKNVELTYKVRYLTESGAESSMEAFAYRVVGNCGQVLNTGR